MCAAPARPDEGPHPGLRLFLSGVRVVGVLSALLISNFHSNPLALTAELSELGWVITAGVVIYHLVAGLIVGMTEARGIAALVIVFDVALGTLLTYLYGEAYFLLVFALPVLEICAAFGLTASLVSAVLGLMFYGVVYARPLLESFYNNSISSETLTLRLSLSGVQAAVTLLLTWLYSLAVAETAKTESARSEKARTADLLYEQLAERTDEIERVYSELNEQDLKMNHLSKELSHLQHELEQAYRDLAKARLTLNSRESQAEETVSRLSDEMVRERKMLEVHAARLERELDLRNRTLEGFRQLLSSLSLEETLLALVYHLQSRLPSVVCVVFMKEDVQGTHYLYPEVADAADTAFFRELAIPVGEQAVGWVAASGRSLKIDDTQFETENGVVEVLPNQGRSALILPLRDNDDGSTLGVVYMSRNEPGAYKSEDLSSSEEFLELASIAVSRCLEFRQRVGGGLHDTVTGLHNGLYLAERMEEEVRRGRRYTYPVALMMIDIDRFAPVAANLSSEVLDNVLRQVAGLILAEIRETDVAARIDADDFGVLLVHSDRNSAVPIGERIRSKVAEATFGTPGHPLRLTVSVGVAGVPHDASDGPRLKEVTFGALNEARSAGGNRVATYPR